MQEGSATRLEDDDAEETVLETLVEVEDKLDDLTDVEVEVLVEVDVDALVEVEVDTLVEVEVVARA